MELSKVLNAVLGIALLVCVIKLAYARNDSAPASSAPATAVDSSAIVLHNIMTRTSIRAYTDQEVPDSIVTQLLQAAMAAPTAVNKQPWAFVVIRDPDQANKLADVLPYAQMIRKAPLTVVACGDLSLALDGEAREYWVQDVSASIENLLLAAHGFGLGAVWTGIYPIQERVQATQKCLSLPSHLVPLAAIPVGYPAQQPTPKDKWTEDKVYYETYEAED